MRPLPNGRRREIDDEIRHHIDEAVDLLVEEGLSPEAAREEALRRFGDAGRIRTELDRVGRRSPLKALGDAVRSLGGDLRYAIRGLRNNPSFALACTTTLALGLSASMTAFAIVDALLLRPLAYRDADRWVEVRRERPDGGHSRSMSAERFQEWRRSASGVLDGWVAYRSVQVVRTDGAAPEALSGVAVTAGANRLLGLPIELGRGFTSEDTRPGAPPVALLSHDYWRRLGSDRGILGRTLRTETGPITVVGVMAEGPRFPTYGGARDLWVPLRDDFTWADRENGGVQGIWAHLAGDLSPSAAQLRLDAIAESMDEVLSSGETWRVDVRKLQPFRGNVPLRRALWTLAGTVAAILLIALVNGVNLALVRASSRGRELAVRVAIGGSWRRLLRQFLIEGTVVGVVGGVAGALMARGALAAVRGILPSEVEFFTPHAIAIDARVLTFGIGASLMAGIAIGLAPAVQSLRRKSAFSLLSSRSDDTPSLQRLRHGLVVTQVALTMTLLVTAGLLTRSMARLLSVDPGFQVERVAVAEMMASPSRYPDAAARAAFLGRLEAALEARPEIEEVSISTGSGFASGGGLQAEGSDVREGGPSIIPYTEVAEDWFSTMGVTLSAGRALTSADAEQRNVIIDRDMARYLWNDEAPLGRRFRLGEDREWMTVVGVVPELRLMGRDQREGPYQLLQARAPGAIGDFMSVAMRTSGSPESLLPIFRETLRSVDPEQWVWRLRTGASALAEEEDTPRFLLTVMAFLASIATALSAVGLHGVLAYAVGRRRREVGVRMALGAEPARVRQAVLGDGLLMAAGGMVLGTLGALALSGVLQRLLYEIESRDPLVYGATLVLLLGVSVLAAWAPAYRATQVDPVEVLKAE